MEPRADARGLGELLRAWSATVADALRPWLGRIVLAWCLGVLLFAQRPLLGWWTARRLRRVGVSPVSEAVRKLLQRSARRLGVRRAVVALQSTLVRVPVAVGHFRPVILLPASLITGLPPDQLEAILAHELAHIRRHDYLVNLLQTLAETFFFYHPAVWWLSGRIRDEREHCCDDLAVAAVGDRVEYGRALLALEELRGPSATLVVGARGGTLLARMRRLFQLEPGEQKGGVMAVAGLSLFVVLVTAVVFWAATLNDGPTARGAEHERLEPKRFRAKLPDGLTVELLAVVAHDVETASAWRPDGGPFDTGLELPTWEGLSPIGLGPKSRVVVLKFTGLTANRHVTYRLSGKWMALHRDKDGVARLAIATDDEHKPLSFAVGISDEQWGPFQTVNTQGNIEKAIEPPAACRDIYERFKPDHIKGFPQETHFRWSGLKPMDDRAEREVVAVDLDGQRHKPYGRTVWQKGGEHFAVEVFQLPRSRIARFEYRLRPYRHWVTFENVSPQPGRMTDVKITARSVPVDRWGAAVNGLRARVVPVLASMSEDAIDPTQRVSKFAEAGDVAFVVEIQNMSDEPVKLLDTRYGEGYGKSTGKPHSDWFGQFLFSIDYFDADGKKIARPEVEVVDVDLAITGALPVMLQPGKTHSY
ncbi:MAG: M56 family metallopeptidase, partial [Planctomycetes bacterium]|nr:M56 family metallopeptidase [Planctomycetota bacterium]